MTGLSRYIFRQTMGTLVFVAIVLTAAIWLTQSLRLIDLIVNRGLSLNLFLWLALLVMPRFLDVVLPIAVFIGVLFTYNKLITESEVVVMRSAGLSDLRLAQPGFYVAIAITILLYALSSYVLPASNRQFRDLQFEVRNQFVSAALLEGTFNTLSNRLTVYVRSRAEGGELSGILVHDTRDPEKPVTVMAERGAFVEAEGGPRVVMLNGNRQQFDRQAGNLTVLTFERYTLDLGALRDAPGVRIREPQERYLHELFAPAEGLSPAQRQALVVEGHQRIVTPLYALAFAAIALAALLSGEFNRRGLLQRVLVAILIAFIVQTADLAMKNLANRLPSLIPLMYLNVLVPLLGSALMLWRGGRLRTTRVLSPG